MKFNNPTLRFNHEIRKQVKRTVLMLGAVSVLASGGCATHSPATDGSASRVLPTQPLVEQKEPLAGVEAKPATFSPSALGYSKKEVETPAELAVRDRAQTRWGHLLKSNMQEAYAFLSPNAKQLQSFEAYNGAIRSGLWRSAEIARVDCAEAARCVVYAQVVIRVPIGRLGPTDHTSFVREDWVSANGQWWFVPTRG